MKASGSNRWRILGVALCMSFSLAGAAAQSAPGEGQLVSSNTGFGFHLLKQLARGQDRANIFISPYSISSVLQMVGNGARGQTRQELQQVLGTGGLSLDAVNSASAALNHSITSVDTNLLLSIANAIWYRNGVQLNPAFAAANEKFYHAQLAGMDFADLSSVQRMNQWAAQNTHGRIQTIIQPPLPGDTAMVLANAIYFKGTWLNPFDPKLTKPLAFHLADGADPQVPMMEQTRTFAYQAGLGYQAIQLPYAGKRLEMEILLPGTNSTVETLLDGLDAKSWQDTVLAEFKQSRGTLVLPRLKIRYGADLRGPLAALGLKRALRPGADFSGMSASPLYLSEVKHQSFVEVNEQGTEAAAVTTGVMALAAMRNQPPPFYMVVDRPFLFMISDRSTKSVLFLGLVRAPQS